MQLSSPDFAFGEHIPPRFTCDGEDINPELHIGDVPPQAKSLVLVVRDPDAPSGTWIHWALWNIDPQIERISAGTVPIGATEGMTDFGRTGYGGPCPPEGTHRYFFNLYALDTELKLGSSATVEDLTRAMESHILRESEYVGLYTREEEL